MRRIRLRKSRDEDGAAAVEFALISVVLFLLIFGILEFGSFYSQYQVFQGAAREGARLAAVRSDPASVETRVKDAADPYTVNGAIAVAVEGGGTQCSGSTIGNKVTVSWPQSFDISLPFVPAIKATPTIRAVFKCE